MNVHREQFDITGMTCQHCVMHVRKALTAIPAGMMEKCKRLAAVYVPVKVQSIGSRAFADCKDLHLAGGYDHCFNFTNWKACASGGEIKIRAVVCDELCKPLLLRVHFLRVFVSNGQWKFFL